MAQPGGAGPCRGQDREHLLIPRAPEKPALRIGPIGTGFMGKAHVFGYASAQKVFDLPMAPVLYTVADITEERAASAADAFGFAHSTGDWQTMIADPEIDAIHITAPNALHKEMALAAIAAGKHVHCEKPLAPTAEDAREMADAAEARGVKTQVGFNYLCNPMIGLAKAMIATGELGEIRGYRGLHCEDYMADAEGPFTFRHEPAGGGALADIGSHALATAEFLLGPITEVMGHCVTVIAERSDGPRPVAGIVPRQMPEGVRGPMKGRIAALDAVSPARKRAPQPLRHSGPLERARGAGRDTGGGPWRVLRGAGEGRGRSHRDRQPRRTSVRQMSPNYDRAWDRKALLAYPSGGKVCVTRARAGRANAGQAAATPRGHARSAPPQASRRRRP